jgi:hypothetical protein
LQPCAKRSTSWPSTRRANAPKKRNNASPIGSSALLTPKTPFRPCCLGVSRRAALLIPSRPSGHLRPCLPASGHRKARSPLPQPAIESALLPDGERQCHYTY